MSLIHCQPPERPEAAHQAHRQRQGDRGHAECKGGWQIQCFDGGSDTT